MCVCASVHMCACVCLCTYCGRNVCMRTCVQLELTMSDDVAGRTSHNPPDKRMLEIYDRVGIVVMDENRLFSNTTAFVENMGQQ